MHVYARRPHICIHMYYWKDQQRLLFTTAFCFILSQRGCTWRFWTEHWVILVEASWNIPHEWCVFLLSLWANWFLVGGKKQIYIYIYTFICALLIGLQKLVSGWYLPIIHALCTWCESKLPDKKLLGPIKLWQWWFGPCPSQSGYDWVGLKISGPIGQSLNGPAVWPSMTVYVISRDLL